MQLLPKQQHAVYYLKDSITKEILYGGAAGGAKTTLGCMWLIESCQKYPGSRWLMGRSKLKALKRTTLSTFFDLVKIFNISDQFTYNAQSNEITWNNGSVIILMDLFLYPSDPNFDDLGSLEICGAFVDECNQVVHKAWQIVKSRCRYKLKEFGIVGKVLGSCNPAKNWTYKEFYKKDKDGTLDSTRKFIQALPTDNPHLPESYLESLLSLDKNSVQRLYYGNWEYDDDPSALIDTDAIADYFNPIHIPRGGTKYLTIDVARKGKDKTVFRVWEGFLCTHRYEIPEDEIPPQVEKAKEIQRNHGISNSCTIADEDGVGGGFVDMLRCKGFINNLTPIKELVGDTKITPNYKNLKSQCAIRMANKIQNRQAGELCNDSLVRDRTSEEMEQVKIYNMDKDVKLTVLPKEKIKDLIGRSTDDWDSIMMRYYFELQPKRSIRIRTRKR